MKRLKQLKQWPIGWIAVLGVLVLGCLLAPWIAPFGANELNLADCLVAPNRTYWFGTDSLGRDLFSMIWYGGRVSLSIGLFATMLSTVIAFLYGTISGLAPAWLDRLMMRWTEFLLSIPSILMVIFVQAIVGGDSIFALAVVIGATSWMTVAKLVRTQVRQLRAAEFVLASRCMGGGFLHLLWRHLMPNYLPSVLFMLVMNLSGAIATEATLSFLGLGLPVDVVSWGSMLSLAQNALLTGGYWVILVPGMFLVITMLCLVNIAHHLMTPKA